MAMDDRLLIHQAGLTRATREAYNQQDLPTGRGGDPPGLSISLGSSQGPQVRISGEHGPIDNNQISLTLATDGAVIEEDIESENSLVAQQEHEAPAPPSIPGLDRLEQATDSG